MVRPQFITAQEIQKMLRISRSGAYALIRQMNSELEEAGYFTLRGKVPYRYFQKKIYGLDEADVNEFQQIG